MSNSRGMTLLELLVALAVFALLSAMAYGGLGSVLKADRATTEQAAELVRLQQAMTLISRDLGQVVMRPVRDSFGDPQPPLDGRAETRLELTRAGWSNPASRLRSTLQRVSYRQDGDLLVRDFWSVLDRAQDSLPLTTTLLSGVRNFEYRFLNSGREWNQEWPPQLEQGVAEGFPLAVEITLELEHWGRIRRVIPLP